MSTQPSYPTPQRFLHLQAVNKRRNIARCYIIETAQDLFGHWIVILRWGRIGSMGYAGGKSRIVSFTCQREAAYRCGISRGGDSSNLTSRRVNCPHLIKLAFEEIFAP
ncbi:MAG: WGR domain-containing protein [Rhodomicrobium sp.]|nr:WGR domain-containing protein [Rhodomicrobium sp.]